MKSIYTLFSIFLFVAIFGLLVSPIEASASYSTYYYSSYYYPAYGYGNNYGYIVPVSYPNHNYYSYGGSYINQRPSYQNPVYNYTPNYYYNNYNYNTYTPDSAYHYSDYNNGYGYRDNAYYNTSYNNYNYGSGYGCYGYGC